MAIRQITTDFAGQIGVLPRLVRINTDDTLSEVTAENYLKGAISQGFTFYPTDLAEVTYLDEGNSLTDFFSVSMTSGSITLAKLNVNPTDLGTAAYKTASDNDKTYLASVLAPVVAGGVATFVDENGTLEDGGPLGNAAFKGVSDESESNVASITGSFTIDHIAQIADANGTIKDGGVLGTAAAKAASDNSQIRVVSLNGTTSTINALPLFSDVNGTIIDTTVRVISGIQPWAGGTVDVLNVPGLTASWATFATITNSTNLVTVHKAVPGTDTLTVTLSGDPGASTGISYLALSGPLSS